MTALQFCVVKTAFNPSAARELPRSDGPYGGNPNPYNCLLENWCNDTHHTIKQSFLHVISAFHIKNGKNEISGTTSRLPMCQ